MKLFLLLSLSLAAAVGAQKTIINRPGERAASSYTNPAGSTSIATANQIQGFITVEGPDLKSRLDAAVKQGRSQGKRFWTAYTFDVRPGIGIDVVIIGSRGSVMSINGMTTSAGNRYETRNLGVFLLHEKDGNSIARAEIYNLERARDYSGYGVYWLGRGHNEESLSLLASLIKASRSIDVADNLTDAIGAHDDPRAEAILKDLIRTSSIERVRTTAVSWLGHIPGQTPFLAGMVRDEGESVEVRKEAADAIGESVDGDALSTLQNLFASVRNREVRKEILDAVSDNDNKLEAINFLIRVAEGEPDRELRKEAIEALGEQEDAPSLQALERIASDSNADSDLQRTAVEAIGERPEKEAAPLLMKIAKTHSQMRVRIEAIERLGEIPGQTAFLVDLARNDAESLEARKEAISAIAESDEAGTVSALQSLYSSISNKEVKREILDSVEDSENKDAAINFLLEVARNDSDRELREEAISALGEMDGARSVQALSELYDSEQSEEMKEDILSALGESDQKEALKKLMQVAGNDPSVKMRKRAIEALGESDDPEAIRFLERIVR